MSEDISGVTKEAYDDELEKLLTGYDSTISKKKLKTWKKNVVSKAREYLDKNVEIGMLRLVLRCIEADFFRLNVSCADVSRMYKCCTLVATFKDQSTIGVFIKNARFF